MAILAVITFCFFLGGLQLLRTRYQTGLRTIPGPFIASFSNIWKFSAVYTHAIHQWSIDAHEKWGPVVRIGPNHVSFASPEAMQRIHGGKDALPKSGFYEVTSPLYQNSPLVHLFSAQDVSYHASLKRHVASLYTKTAVERFEHHVDACVRLMMDQLSQKRPENSLPIDMSLWLHLYAFDSLCAINVSKTFGFLEAGRDVGGLIARGDYIMYLFGLYSQSPLLQKINAWMKWLKGLDRKNPLLAYTSANIRERGEKPNSHQDMLNAFLKLHNEQPEKVSIREATGAIYINLMAGHDVLATTLRAIFYYVARHPEVQQKLRLEIVSVSGKFEPQTLLSHRALTRLSYLDAVVHEALRVHANTGMILERVVPSGGVTIDGYNIPEGTIVGCNAWVLHRNQDIFGEDVQIFRPERWLGKTEEQVTEMKRNIFSFGAGPRMCIGRNIAWLQILKLVAEFYRRFDAQLAHPDRPWKVDGSWVTTQTDMDMVVRSLESTRSTSKEAGP